jgi:hypothetical protein
VVLKKIVPALSYSPLQRTEVFAIFGDRDYSRGWTLAAQGQDTGRITRGWQGLTAYRAPGAKSMGHLFRRLRHSAKVQSPGCPPAVFRRLIFLELVFSLLEKITFFLRNVAT